MPNSVRAFVDAIKMFDVHEHHFPEVLLNPEVNLLQLFRESYAGWTQVRSRSRTCRRVWGGVMCWARPTLIGFPAVCHNG